MRFVAFVLLVALTAFTCGCKKSDLAADDKARAQGEWVVEKVEGLPEGEGPKGDELKRVAISIKDNLITIRTEGKDNVYATFAIDVAKMPKWVDLTEANEKGEAIQKGKATTGVTGEPPAESIRAVYKFEGDGLVIAAGLPGVPRPSEFKAVTPKQGVPERDSGGVVVIYLKRK